MKNNIIMVLTFLATVGLVGNASANRTIPLPNNGVSRPALISVIPSGAAYSDKVAGVEIQTITGEVISANSDKNVYLIKDRYDNLTATVLTDAPLSLGQMVTVKLLSGSAVAQLVGPRNSGNTEAPVGMVSYKKEGGFLTQTNMGVVKSINLNNNVFVIENKHCPLTTVVSADSDTIASLRLGQTVSAKINLGNPRAISVGIGS